MTVINLHSTVVIKLDPWFWDYDKVYLPKFYPKDIKKRFLISRNLWDGIWTTMNMVNVLAKNKQIII